MGASMQPVTHNQPEYTVSEIASGVKRVVEENFGRVRVRGELSQFKVVGSGHAYFSLKDDKSVISAVCWKGTLPKLGFKPEDGVEVVATGKVTTYPGRSQYQLIVEAMEVAGEGALMALLEKRKKMLAAEGLFDPARKKPLPFLPEVIGIVTSPTGAVIRDILHRLGDRFPRHVLVWPVLVQGDGAAEQVAAAVRGFNGVQGMRPDVLIVARGGGSIEDLWAFNEEVLVRAVAESQIPVISAVGHETDTTLIDFASDKRAPTPTAAAEMAVPVRADLLAAVEAYGTRSHVAVQRRLQHQREHLEALARALPRPQQILQGMTQRLDDWAERLQGALPRLVAVKLQHAERVSERLKPSLVAPVLQQKLHALALVGDRLQQRMAVRVEREEGRVALLARVLETMDVKRVMQRGFALVRGDKGLVVNAAQAQGTMRIEWLDGSVEVVAKKPKGPDTQGSLF